MKRLLGLVIIYLTLLGSTGFAQPFYGDTLWARDYSSTGAFSCAFSPDGTNLAVAYECMGPIMRVLNVSDGLINWESETPDLCLYNLQFSNNGQYIAIAEELGHLLVIDMTIPDTVYNIDTQTGGLNSVDFSSDGMYIFAGGDDGSIKIYETSSGMLHHSIPSAHMDAVLSVDVSPDDHYLVSGGKDDMVKVWDLENNYQMVHDWMDAMEEIKTVKFGPIGDKILAGSADDNIYVYRTNTWTLDTVLDLHTGDVNIIDISADGSFAVSGSNDQSAKMINLYNYEVNFTFTNLLQTRVYGAAISPDMTKLATGNHIGYVILYDIHGLIGIENTYPEQLKIYPNPATDHVYVNGLESTSTYQLLDVNGKICQAGNTSHYIDVSGLPRGLYLLRVGLHHSKIIKR